MKVDVVGKPLFCRFDELQRKTLLITQAQLNTKLILTKYPNILLLPCIFSKLKGVFYF